jgi:hypothetical protein
MSRSIIIFSFLALTSCQPAKDNSHNEIIPETEESDIFDCTDFSSEEKDSSETGSEDAETGCYPEWKSGKVTGIAAIMADGDQGISKYEFKAYEKAAEILLGCESIYDITTYFQEQGVYEIRTAQGFVKFKRISGEKGISFEITDHGGINPIPDQDLMKFETPEEEFDAGENPHNTSYPDDGYPEGDPRLSFIEPENHSYPHAFARISSMFDSVFAPDLHYGLKPYSNNEGLLGGHGNLDIIQSRATLIFSGAGIRKGAIIDRHAYITDIAPTVLALLSAGTTEGIDGNGHYATGLFLKWQDGNVLDEVFDNQCAGGAEYASILLFDGLNPNELMEQYQSNKQDIPNFSYLIENGSVMKYGAITGYPSVSVTGHISVGTGVSGGHHGFGNNGLYDRKTKISFNSGYILKNITEIIKNPQIFVESYMHFFNPSVETIFQSVKRNFGEDVFTAAVNEPTWIGTDYSILNLIFAGSPESGRSDYSAFLDEFAITQIADLFESGKNPIPKLLYVSFYSTDYWGEHNGPHGDKLREKLKELDFNIGRIIKLYKEAGIFEKTAFVICSDHGMEIQDNSRSCDWSRKLKQSKLKFVDPDGYGFMYLLVMRIYAETSPADQGKINLGITVTDDDTGEPVKNAGIEIKGGECNPCTSKTKEDGKSSFKFAPAEDKEIHVKASHPKFNDSEITIEL